MTTSIVSFCAQRLAASEVWELGAQAQLESHARAQRLAASEVWELWFATASGLPDLSAQRLAASEVWELLWEFQNLLDSDQVRAQRLAASEVWERLRQRALAETYCAQRLAASEVWEHKIPPSK